MFETIQMYLPVEWRRPFEFLAAPLWWIPEWQGAALAFAVSGSSLPVVGLKGVLFLLPILLLIVAVWSTMVGLYTVPFRSERRRFTTTLMLAWWDAGRSIWLYWAGLARFAVALAGWVWGLLALGVRLLGRTLRALFVSPMRFMGWSTRRYFRPGVPWLAFVLTLGWSALEATIFTFTLSPTLREVLAGITGYMPNTTVMLPLVWLFLFFLIAGSFACLQVLNEAVQSRQKTQIVEMLFVEVFVMFFEVVFLYRELIDAITPWVAQTTGGQVQLGLLSTLAIASFGWIGIRGMTWFLFGRYGTPALLAVLSRKTLEQESHEVEASEPQSMDPWRAPIAAFKEQTVWLRDEARRASELVSLPVLQLLAAAVNFPVIVVQSKPVFTLPLQSMDDVLEATPFVDRDGTERSRPSSYSPSPAYSGSERDGS